MRVCVCFFYRFFAPPPLFSKVHEETKTKNQPNNLQKWYN